MPSFLSSPPPHVQKARELYGPPAKGAPHSVAVPNSEKPGRTKIYRNHRFPDGPLDTLSPEIRTTHDLFELAVKYKPNKPYLGARSYNSAKKAWGPFVWQDWETVAKRRHDIGKAIVELHEREGIYGRQYGVGLWCQNRPEWSITDLACNSQSLYTVSLYDTLGPDAAEFIIRHANLACVVTSLAHVSKLIKLKPRLPSLKLVIILDALDAATDEDPALSKKILLENLCNTFESNLKIYSLAEVEELGQTLQKPLTPPKSDDIVTINYTSGTTGNPKGVVLRHRHAVAAAMGAAINVTPSNREDIYLSYLPLAHIYGRLVEAVSIFGNAKVGSFHGNILELVDDLKTLRPTTFTSVPRLYNRFGGVIKSQTVDAPGFRGSLSRHIVNTKMANLNDEKNPTNKHMVYDRIWGRKILAALGLDRANSWVSGSAPLDPALQKFFSIVSGQRVMQGYGMTETYGVALLQQPEDMATGTCGAVGAPVEACLLSVPDMEYTVDDKPYPRGELLLRGHCVFEEYYKNPEETNKAFTEDGWFKTGDIAMVDDLGKFAIIDRRKNVLKLAQGEYVSPERIEGVYLSAHNYLAQAFVHGDSMQTFMIAIFGVQPDLFAPFASKILGRQISPTDLAAIKEACKDPKVKAAVLKDLDKTGRKNKFAGYERVKNIHIDIEPFTIENEALTPTLKLKRPTAAKMYRSVLDDLYAEALEWEKANPKAKL